MSHVGRHMWTALAGLVFVVLYVAAFSLGIEVGPSDREILDYYGDSGHRSREVAAFFVIAAAALALVLFSLGLRTLVARAEQPPAPLAALVFVGGVADAVLILAGNSLSRATAFAATDAVFTLDVNTRRLFEDAGLLLLASGAIAAMLMVAGTGVAALRLGVLPRWLGWTSFVAAALLPLAVGFLGFLVFFLWVLLVSGVIAFRRASTPTAAAAAVPAARSAAHTAPWRRRGSRRAASH